MDGESLGIKFGILSNQIYLHGTKFEVVVDHKPLLPMYNTHSCTLPVRVSKHKNQLAAFDFKVLFELGLKNPADFPLRNTYKYREYSKEEKERQGVEDEMDNVEVLIKCVDEVKDAITTPIIARYSQGCGHKKLCSNTGRDEMSREIEG